MSKSLFCMYALPRAPCSRLVSMVLASPLLFSILKQHDNSIKCEISIVTQLVKFLVVEPIHPC